MLLMATKVVELASFTEDAAKASDREVFFIFMLSTRVTNGTIWKTW